MAISLNKNNEGFVPNKMIATFGDDISDFSYGVSPDNNNNNHNYSQQDILAKFSDIQEQLSKLEKRVELLEIFQQNVISDMNILKNGMSAYSDVITKTLETNIGVAEYIKQIDQQVSIITSVLRIRGLM